MWMRSGRHTRAIVSSVGALANYAPGIVVSNQSKWALLSGQLGVRSDGSVPTCPESQAEQCFTNIAKLLKTGGFRMRDVVKVNGFVTEREHMASYMRARDRVFGKRTPPASTLMIVRGFTRPEFKVEVEAVAVRNYRRRRFSTLVDELRAEGLSAIAADEGDNERREVKRRSRDYFWYSPILKPELDTKMADVVVTAKSEEDVQKLMRISTKRQVPLVTRGAGTGNYGQAVPFQKGIVLDVSQLSGIVSLDAHGTCRAWAGTKLSEIEDAARQIGWELRQHPSTRRNATIGGYIAGGSTGHGALRFGGLAEVGAILGIRLVLPNGDIVELNGHAEIGPAVHAYGTTGCITQVEMPLAPAQPWRRRIFHFNDCVSAAHFARQVAIAPALDVRGISVFQDPIASKYLEIGEGDVVLMECAQSAVDGIDYLCTKGQGRDYDKERPIYENGWNHTTLHALKKNKQVTYLQALMSNVDLVAAVQHHFPPTKLLQHLECVDSGNFASLALLFPENVDELREMLRWHERRMPVFDPHTPILEDGGMKDTSAIVDFKTKHDPLGLLNPGKLRDSSSTAAAPPPATSIKSRYWADWTTQQVAEEDLSGAVAVLPLGAIEAHGPHLPLGTDAMHNEALLAKALDLLPAECTVLALPPLAVGVSSEHKAFAGTLSLTPETALQAWFELAACVKRAGIRKIVLYNSHGGNHPLAEVLARKVRLELDVLCVLAMNLCHCPDDLFPTDELKYGIHGGAVETSIMLSLRPDLVHLDHARDFESSALEWPWHAPGFNPKSGWLSQDLNPAGVVGNAKSHSDASKGAELAQLNSRALADLLLKVYDIDADSLLGNTPHYPPSN